MNLKISKAAADLTSPSVPLQDFSTEPLVGFGRKPQTGMFGSDRIHEARWEICDKKACFCSPGRNLKNRAMECSKMSGLPLSRFAPARKSAQIISKQKLRDLSLPSIRAAVSIACSMTGI